MFSGEQSSLALSRLVSLPCSSLEDSVGCRGLASEEAALALPLFLLAPGHRRKWRPQARLGGLAASVLTSTLREKQHMFSLL